MVNRLLLIFKVAGLPLDDLAPYCDSQDSKELWDALKHHEGQISAGEGAAPYRFMLAYAASKGLNCTLTAKGSMLRRSIAPLVNSLREAGAEIDYTGADGFPPVLIRSGIREFGKLQVNTETSSQFASALMLVAPLFPGKKYIETSTKRVSEAYLHMSAALMEACGVAVTLDPNIEVSEGMYALPKPFPVETDWSAAAFFYSLACMMPGTAFSVEGLKQHSLQGDSILPELFACLGVRTEWNPNGIACCATQQNQKPVAHVDFSDTPDLLPAFLVACAAQKRRIHVTGIDHLAYKESNRLELLQRNFRKIKVSFQPQAKGWTLDASGWNPGTSVVFETGKDHRIAMAFALLAVFTPVGLDDTACVAKSFPGFWEELRKCNLYLNH
jgi:3-phosphoshikimate 1-carboxyvinyltransferase